LESDLRAGGGYTAAGSGPGSTENSPGLTTLDIQPRGHRVGWCPPGKIEIKSLGVVGYLKKPFDVSKLLATVEQYR